MAIMNVPRASPVMEAPLLSQEIAVKERSNKINPRMSFRFCMLYKI